MALIDRGLWTNGVIDERGRRVFGRLTETGHSAPYIVRYLSMNGTSAYIKTPSVTFDKVVLDMRSRAANDSIYFDARNGVALSYFQKTGSGSDNWGTGISSVKVNGATATNSTTFIPYNTRVTVEINLTSAGTDDINIFSGSSATSFVNGDLYSIKIYNGSTLQAHYDMSTGTLNNQVSDSSIGSATLTGGTWITDNAIASDSFNRPDTSAILGSASPLDRSDTGQSWIATSGGVNLSITNNQLTVSGSDCGGVVDSGYSDSVAVSATFVTLTGGEQIIFRYAGSASYFYVERSGTGYQLIKRSGGFSNLHTAASATTPVVGDVIKVVLNGSNISVYQNGNLLYTVTDTFNQTATMHGLGTGGGNHTFDNFRVEPVAFISSTTTSYTDPVVDSFNRANSTTTLGKTDSGKAWVTTATFGGSVWGISGGMPYTPTSTQGAKAYVDSGLSDNIRLSMDITGNQAQAGLVFRYTSESSHFFVVKNSPSGFIVKRSIGGGDNVVVGTGGTVSYTTSAKASIVLNGSTIRLYENDVLVGTFTDTNGVTGTKHGTQSSNYTTPSLDNFRIQPLTVVVNKISSTVTSNTTSTATPTLSGGGGSTPVALSSTVTSHTSTTNTISDSRSLTITTTKSNTSTSNTITDARSLSSTVNSTTSINTLIASDSFTRSDTTSGLGSTESVQGFPTRSWLTDYNKTWGISGNRAYLPGATLNGAVSFTEMSLSDGTIQTTFPVITANTALVFRYSGQDNWIQVQATSSTYVLRRFNFDEGSVTMGTYSIVPANGDTIAVKLNGTQIQVFINNIGQTPVTASRNVSATKYGFAAGDNTARIDDFTFKSLGTSPSVAVAMSSNVVKSNTTSTATPTLTNGGSSVALSSTVTSHTSTTNTIKDSRLISSTITSHTSTNNTLRNAVAVLCSTTSHTTTTNTLTTTRALISSSVSHTSMTNAVIRDTRSLISTQTSHTTSTAVVSFSGSANMTSTAKSNTTQSGSLKVSALLSISTAKSNTSATAPISDKRNISSSPNKSQTSATANISRTIYQYVSSSVKSNTTSTNIITALTRLLSTTVTSHSASPSVTTSNARRLGSTVKSNTTQITASSVAKRITASTTSHTSSTMFSSPSRALISTVRSSTSTTSTIKSYTFATSTTQSRSAQSVNVRIYLYMISSTLSRSKVTKSQLLGGIFVKSHAIYLKASIDKDIMINSSIQKNVRLNATLT